MTIRLVVKNEKQDAGSAAKTLTFSEMLITVGSLYTATLRLDDPQIAPEQAVIINENGQPLFINQNKGTILNGQEIEQGLQHKLQSGDHLKIGFYSITVELENKVESNNFSEAPTRLLDNSIAANFLVQQDSKSKPQAEKEVIEQESSANKIDARNFRDILKGLRKEEDQFYFQITDSDGAKRRILLEGDEVVLGWNLEHNIFAANQQLTIEQPHAIARKDWSGVTIYPSGEDPVLLNNSLLEAAAQLRNGDKLVFKRKVNEATQIAMLIFCEPAALVELNAILPQQLLTTALEAGQTGEIKAETQTAPEAAKLNPTAANNHPKRPADKPKKLILGYFNQIEILVIILGTILTAVVTFLLLLFFY